MSKVFFRLTLILNAIDIIQKRTFSINSSEEFISGENGIILLDSINARLQTLGENLNKILRSNSEIIEKPEIDPLPIIEFRNIISHEYELLDYQIIYKICRRLTRFKRKDSIFFIKQR